jgi:uncharacterized membrane protein YphA (DoxX/SURF4 family)
MDITANYAKSHSHQTELTQADKVHSILRWTFGLVPIAAGADKFTHLLTDWNQYLAPQIANILPFPAGTFMTLVGIIEIIAGIIVLVKPRIGGLIVSLWLVGIALNLLISGQYFDIAVRDIVMAIAAFCLYLLGKTRH